MQRQTAFTEIGFITCSWAHVVILHTDIYTVSDSQLLVFVRTKQEIVISVEISKPIDASYFSRHLFLNFLAMWHRVSAF